MATKCVHISIRGRVTGVFFRAAAQREARRLGVTGWVRNRNDASIEILAEGDEDAVKEMIGWAHHGPSAARVDNVDVRYRSFSGDYSDFQIVE